MDFIIQILNLLYLIFVYLRLYLFFQIPLFSTFKNDNERIKKINYIGDVTFRDINNIFKKRVLINGELKKLNKLTIINYNHVHNTDNLMGWIIFFINKIKPCKISSISSYNHISDFDMKILNMINAIDIGNILDDLEYKLEFFNSRDYNRYIMTYFEGITLNHNKQKPYYKYINRPKYLAFEILCNKFKNKKFYDIDMVYTYKNILMNPKDKYFIWKLLHPKCKIYVNIKECIFPDKNEREYLDNLYLNKNKNIKNVLTGLI